MQIVDIQNTTRQLPEPLEAGYCDSFTCRLKGLMFRSKLDQQSGLLLVQPRDSRIDSSIHMLFVFMDLAVIWINSVGVVVDIVLAQAWHPFYSPRSPARYILEIHPSRIDEFKIGDMVSLPND
jgi:uncharacterized membrane protein (UPF0127 family)